LLLENGDSIYESSYILEYLELKHPAPPMLSTDGDERLASRRLEVLCDGICDAVVLTFFERRRPSPCQSLAWSQRQRRKIEGGVREMARLLRHQGLLFCSVPNRLYPFEIHTRKWGWNYFPNALSAQIVDCTAWEVQRLARPLRLKMHRTPVLELFRPWSNFCLRRDSETSSMRTRLT